MAKNDIKFFYDINTVNLKESIATFQSMLSRFNKRQKLLNILNTGEIVEIQSYLQKNPDVEWSKEEALINAVLANHLELVKWLIEQGANIHYQKEQAFILAMMLKDMSIAEYLVKHQANVTLRHAPLKQAIGCHNLIAIQYLFEIYPTNQLQMAIHLVKKSEDIEIRNWLKQYQHYQRLNQILKKQENLHKPKI